MSLGADPEIIQAIHGLRSCPRAMDCEFGSPPADFAATRSTAEIALIHWNMLMISICLPVWEGERRGG